MPIHPPGDGRLRTWVSLLAVTLACASCDNGATMVLNLDATSVPSTITSLVLRSSLNGVLGQDQTFAVAQRRIALHLPPGSSGTIVVSVTGVDGGGCRVSLGGVQSEVPMGLSRASEDSIVLKPNGAFDCWQTIPTGSPQNLRAIAGLDAQTVFVAGDGGTLLRCSGSTNSCIKLETKIPNNLNALWISNDGGDVYAAGRSGVVLRCSTASNACVLLSTGVANDFVSIWGTAANEIYVAGDYIMRCSRASDSCTYAAILPSGPIQKVLGTDPSNVYAAGRGGAVVRCPSQSSCVFLRTDVADDLRAIAKLGSSGVIIVGDSGTILSCETGQFVCSARGDTSVTNLHGAFGTDASNVYAVGESGRIVRCAAGSLKCDAMMTRTTSTLLDVWGRDGVKHVYAVGGGGAVLRCPVGANDCTVQPSGTQATLRAIWGADAKNIYIAGDAGKLLRHVQ